MVEEPISLHRAASCEKAARDMSPATVPQMAHDTVTFLAWASEPNLDDRHRTGVKVILFLLVAAGIFYAMKRKIWAPVH